MSPRLPVLLCALASLAPAPAASAAAGLDPVVKVSVPPGREFRQGEAIQIAVLVTPPADAPGDLTVLVDARGAVDGFVRRMAASEHDCGYLDVHCEAPCPPGRRCFVLSFQLHWSVPIGRLTFPITIVDARGRQTPASAIVDIGPAVDRDADGLPDAWETFYAASSTHDLDPDADANGNGVSNLDEFRRGTNPRVRYARYFADASTGDRGPGVDACFQIAALGDELGEGWYTLIGDDGRKLETGYPVHNHSVRLCWLARTTHPADRVVAAIVESTVPFVVERLVTTPDPAAAPFGTLAVGAPASHWYFADGGTDGLLDAFYLAYNPGTTPVDTTFTFRRSDGTVARQRTAVLPPGVRTTTWVNVDDAPLGRTEAWVEITAAAPILVERAWRFDPPGRTVTQPYASAGSTDVSPRWIFPEIDGQAAYDTTIVLANPSASEAVFDLALLFADRAERTAGRVHVPAHGRIGVPARAIAPEGHASVEIASVNGVGVVAERTFSGRDGHGPWRVADTGAREAGARWTIPTALDSREIVVTNVSPFPARAELHFNRPDNFDVDVVTVIDIPARQRAVYPLDPSHPSRMPWKPGTLRVTSLPTDRGTADLVVEAVRYADVDGVLRARSSGLIGARVP